MRDVQGVIWRKEYAVMEAENILHWSERFNLFSLRLSLYLSLLKFDSYIGLLLFDVCGSRSLLRRGPYAFLYIFRRFCLRDLYRIQLKKNNKRKYREQAD